MESQRHKRLHLSYAQDRVGSNFCHPYGHKALILNWDITTYIVIHVVRILEIIIQNQELFKSFQYKKQIKLIKG